MFDGDWTEQARCAETDPEIFFPEDKAARPARRWSAEAARSGCCAWKKS